MALHINDNHSLYYDMDVFRSTIIGPSYFTSLTNSLIVIKVDHRYTPIPY